MHYIINGLIVVFALGVCALMLYSYRRQRQLAKAPLTLSVKIKLAACGVVAFISDTVGIGSFAVTIAICKYFKLAADEELPGLINTAQVIPGVFEAILFLQVIHVDMLTLEVLVIGACLGGILGGMVVSHFNQERTRIWMASAFILLALLILCNQFNLLPIGGNEALLRGWKLWAGFFGMIVCGFLPALGVGLFALVQVLLFLLGLSPLVAFPVMTTAGALQQPLTSSGFLLNHRVPIRRTIIVSLAGIVGVLITVPFVTHLSMYLLRWLLLAIVVYNATMMLRAYFRRLNT